MLKSLAVAYEDEVCQYVLNRMSNMPGTALRYAIEKYRRRRNAKQ